MRDYKKALLLWDELAGARPTDIHASLRVMQIKLLLEGRQSVADHALKFWKLSGRLLADSKRDEWLKNLYEIQTMFLTDDGMALYYQGLSRMRTRDWLAAVSFFQKAESNERGNLLLGLAQGRCELELGLLDKAHDSFNSSWKIYPFDSVLAGYLAEIEVAQNNFNAPLERYFSTTSIRHGERESIAVALSSVELKKLDLAEDILRDAFDFKSRGFKPNPMYYYIKARLRATSHKTTDIDESHRLFEKFANEGAKIIQDVASSWDPYDISAKIQATRQSKLRSRDATSPVSQ